MDAVPGTSTMQVYRPRRPAAMAWALRVGDVEAARGRQGVVHARLSKLLTALGELPAGAGPARLAAAPPPVCPLGGLCPPRAVVLHGPWLAPGPGGQALPIEHVVVAPRGVVVAQEASTGPAKAAVRGALRRANVLRAWLGENGWPGAPVLAAVFSGPAPYSWPAPALPAPGPVVIDGLWVGAAEHLPAWLASGRALDRAARASMSGFLAGQLPRR
ncbi:MAG: hypothetical protein ACRDZX_14690 [Acidimicrobiales bacterium]